MKQRRQLTKFAWLSLFTAVLTIGLKASAYYLTGSIGLLSDALESGINLVTAALALVTLIVAARPPDEEHAYGHSKVEHLTSAVVGGLILAAGLIIAYSAIQRLLTPQPLTQLGLGLVISVVAALFNSVTAAILLRGGRRYRSPTLAAEGSHLLTDVWTTAGVLAGIAVVALTGWVRLDALIALLVAAHILRSGLRIAYDALNSLMDRSLPAHELEQITAVLEAYKQQGVEYHALRTRQSGAQRFISVHIQVPGAWSVQEGHRLLEELEGELRQKLAPVSVITHLEPVEDPVSWDDIPLVRDVA